MSNSFCVNYLLLISVGGIFILTYIGSLCAANSDELKVENKKDHVYSVFIAAAIYLFIFVVMLGVKCRKRPIVVPQGYQVLDEAS
ncbi:hypothetical protein SteCoe_35748 [Stentor coeruleus]|uniref:Uncharacterized protein n=1 Tax=Stentor coeruleus TaxID=5963 RepID=A0A1R2ARN9_9CILI|nr:hypothetical protein SteCoe_35748 [Stentor coeruleus]